MDYVNAFLSAHPYLGVAFGAIGGAALWAQGVSWVETQGVDKLDSYFAEKQKAAAKRFGFSDAQIAAIEAGEAAAAQRLADDAAARAKADAEKAAGAPKAA